MEKKGFSIAGTTHLTIFTLFFVLVLALSSPSVSSQAAGCCANPGILYGQFDTSFYCSDAKLYQYMCCPTNAGNPIDGNYNATNPYFPDNQEDCQANFYSDTCAPLASCALGCCYNPNSDATIGYCSLSTEYICMLEPGAAWRAEGCGEDFHNCQPIGLPGNTTTNETEVLDTCSQYDGSQADCNANSCSYCASSSKCFSSCFGNCPGNSVDRDPFSACDSDTVYSSCTENKMCEAGVSATCFCGEGLTLEGQYCCELQNQNFTSQDECVDSCMLTCGIGQNISYFFAINDYEFLGYTECRCGQQIANLYTDGSKYCCAINGVTSLKDGECTPKGTLTGHVYIAGTTTPIKGAKITVDTQSAITDSSGKYTLPGLPRDVSIEAIASNDSFADQVVEITLTQSSTTLDFHLSPFYSSCDNPNTLPSVGFAKECDGDAKGISLSWTNPCPSQFIMFQLFRNDTPLGTFTGAGPFRYTDTGFEWEKNTNYVLRTTFTTIKGNGVVNNSLKVFTGYEACLGNAGKSVCMGNKRIICGQEDICINASISCKTTESCVEFGGGNTMCVLPNNCENLGNPFGIFYDMQKCYFNSLNQPNPCYYDYSVTTVDKCYRCADATSCASFLSQDACLNNPCGLGSACSYVQTNEELNKGICYKPGDFSSDSCELCNEPFMSCDSETCDLVGNCGMTLSGCASCNEVATCSQYADEFSCTGGQPYTVPSDGCSASVSATFSNDSCGIGYCRWLNNMCIKDVDYNGINDIYDYELPPVTTIRIPAKIIQEGDIFNFSVKTSLGAGVLTDTYYCISPSGSSCCPTTQVFGNNIQLTSENNPEVGQGIYRIYYYSKYRFLDMKEAAKNSLFYADLEAPSIGGFSYRIEDYSKMENSNLTIYFNVSESSVCSGSMGSEMEPLLKQSIKLYQKQPQQYLVKYVNLSDGEYHYTINCTDFSGNKMIEEHVINIDRVGAILGYGPNYITINTTSVRINVTLNDDGNCVLYSMPEGTRITMSKTQIGGIYFFSALAAGAGVGENVYLIRCTMNSGIKDSAFSWFTVDNIKPTSTFSYTPSGGAAEEVNDGWYPNTSTFSILCADPNYPSEQAYNTPSMFGCNGTRYCMTTGTATSCAQPAKFSSSPLAVGQVTKTTTFYYQSRDAGGNLEAVKSTTVKIDSVPPLKPNVAVTPRYADADDSLNITLRSTDRGSTGTDGGSGIKYYAYTLLSSANTSGKKLFDWKESDLVDGESFLLDLSDITLAPGRTYYLAAKAIDYANLESEINISLPIVINCALGRNRTSCNAQYTNCTCDDCGDGIIQDNELCDDGNANNNDECTNLCKPHRCGDTYVYHYLYLNGTFKGTEECDDGNNVSNDGCASNCTWEKCGDGIKQTSEICDDGNDVDVDACVNCYKAYCGDGYTFIGNESCDYKNAQDKNNCLTNCSWKPNYPPIIAGTCIDGDLNGNETDVDCGGNCPLSCGLSKKCKSNSDCASGLCNITAPYVIGYCAVSSKCTNKVYDIGETDVDCGGICPLDCATGKNCKNNTDCISLTCKDLKCVASSCSDGLKNGNETDVDCGAACTTKCADGKKCVQRSDCKSGICTSGYCEQDPDPDNDGMDDDWETMHCPDGHCDPEGDLDNDGLLNIDEFNQGTDPQDKDTDDDGWNDGKEVEEGYDPLNPDEHPEGGFSWLWILLIIILLIAIAIIFFVASEKKKKRTASTQTAVTHDSSMMLDHGFQKPLGPMGPAAQQPSQPAGQAALPRRRLSDHSDIFKPFNDMYEEKIEGKEKEALSDKDAAAKAAAAAASTAPKDEAAAKPDAASADAKKPSAPDLAEGHDMPGWMKDRSGVWKRLENMNKEELDRMGKTDVDVSGELSSMYGKRLDKNAKDALTRWVLAGIITKDNLPDTMKALAKGGKLNKAVLRYILQNMLSEKKMTKTEMKAMLKEFADNGVLSERDSGDMIDFVKDL